jgi:hypothetical protein
VVSRITERLSRFVRGKGAPEEALPEPNPEIVNSLNFKALFPSALSLDSTGLMEALRSYDAAMSTAVCKPKISKPPQTSPEGLIYWENHIVRLVGVDAPAESEIVERCVTPAHYDAALKEKARAHRSHAQLQYVGYEPDLHEQYVVLAAVGGALATQGALVVLNKTAHTSFPAEWLSAVHIENDRLEMLRDLPLLLLYAGLVKMEVPGEEGLWLRTYGCERLGLPNLAALTEGHHEGNKTFELFSGILDYLWESKAVIEPGHRMRVGEELAVWFRAPLPEEDFLQGEGQMLVAEVVAKG